MRLIDLSPGVICAIFGIVIGSVLSNHLRTLRTMYTLLFRGKEESQEQIEHTFSEEVRRYYRSIFWGTLVVGASFLVYNTIVFMLTIKTLSDGLWIGLVLGVLVALTPIVWGATFLFDLRQYERLNDVEVCRSILKDVKRKRR